MQAGRNIASPDLDESARSFYFLRGRVALCAMLRALGLQKGDEVLIQAYTCLAVPSPVIGLGLTPVYVDIDPATCNMDLGSLEERITPRSRVVVVQHTFGIPAPLDAILALAKRHGLVVIEDCCHVQGSRYNGQELGTFGDSAFYSYEWGKPVIAGIGGGAVIHSDSMRQAVAAAYSTYSAPPFKDVAMVNALYVAHSMLRGSDLFWTIRDVYRLLSRWGLIVSTFRKEEFEGKLNQEYDTRMSDSLLRRLKAKNVPEVIQPAVEHRRQIGSRYLAFANEKRFRTAIPPEGSDTVYLRFPLYLRHKEKVLELARTRHVEIGNWYESPIHPLDSEQLPAVGYTIGSCPNAELLSTRVATLPVTNAISQHQVQRTLDFLDAIGQTGLVEELSPAASTSESELEQNHVPSAK